MSFKLQRSCENESPSWDLSLGFLSLSQTRKSLWLKRVQRWRRRLSSSGVQIYRTLIRPFAHSRVFAAALALLGQGAWYCLDRIGRDRSAASTSVPST